jgi:hypothetical protein
MMSSGVSQAETYRIQPYHMNGLNWTLVPDDPERDNIVIVTGFMPNWWDHEYGISFRRDFHLDPEVHAATLRRMAMLLNERFGELPNFFFSPFDYEDSYPTERRYGDALIPALFDIEVSYDEASGHPYTDCAGLSDRQALALTVPDVENHPALRAVMDGRLDADVPIVGELGFEGVINIAYQLRGQEMFVDFILKPELIHHVFEVVFQTINNLTHTVRKWQDPTDRTPSYFVTCDCLVNMISGKMYREHLWEFDKRFHESFDIFGIHTCNWNIDPYLDAIAQLGSLGYLDMGPDSDIERVHELPGDPTIAVFFHPERLRSLSPREIEKEITELGKRIQRGYILFSDLEDGTTDDQIRAAHEAACRL